MAHIDSEGESEKKQYCIVPTVSGPHTHIFNDGLPTRDLFDFYRRNYTGSTQNAMRRQIYLNAQRDNVVEGLCEFEEGRENDPDRYNFVTAVHVMGITPYSLKHIAWVNVAKFYHYKLEKKHRLIVHRMLELHMRNILRRTTKLSIRFGYELKRETVYCGALMDSILATEEQRSRIHTMLNRNTFYDLRPFCECNGNVFLKIAQNMGDGSLFLYYSKGCDTQALEHRFVERNGHYTFCPYISNNIYFPRDPRPPIYGFNDNVGRIARPFTNNDDDDCDDTCNCCFDLFRIFDLDDLDDFDLDALYDSEQPAAKRRKLS